MKILGEVIAGIGILGAFGSGLLFVGFFVYAIADSIKKWWKN